MKSIVGPETLYLEYVQVAHASPNGALPSKNDWPEPDPSRLVVRKPLHHVTHSQQVPRADHHAASEPAGLSTRPKQLHGKDVSWNTIRLSGAKDGRRLVAPLVVGREGAEERRRLECFRHRAGRRAKVQVPRAQTVERQRFPSGRAWHRRAT